MIYALDPIGKLWTTPTEKNAVVLMQMRFDGKIGFPGGLLNKGPETVAEGLNRELQEEVGFDLTKFSFSQAEHFISHVNHELQLVTHFYVKQVNLDDFLVIEKDVLLSDEWGQETFGTIRAPMYVMEDGFRGLPVFLANRFAGNAKQQLLLAIRKYEIIPGALIDKILDAHEKYIQGKSLLE